MKTYQLECAEINYFVIEVEAQSEDEAIDLAREDINSFEVLDEYVSEWDVNDIKEIPWTLPNYESDKN